MKRFLKNTLLFVVLNTLFCVYPTHTTRTSSPFIVSFQNSKGAIIPIYYKGYRVNPGPASVLPEDGLPFLFYVFISKEVTPCKLHENDVVCLQCSQQDACALYELKLSIDRSDEGDIKEYKWQIKKLPQQKIPSRLPENALLILFDPAFIKELYDDETAHAPGSIMLPTIYFNRDNEAAFNKAVLAATMAALDIEPFNKREYSISSPSSTLKNATVVVPTAGF